MSNQRSVLLFLAFVIIVSYLYYESFSGGKNQQKILPLKDESSHKLSKKKMQTHSRHLLMVQNIPQSQSDEQNLNNIYKPNSVSINASRIVSRHTRALVKKRLKRKAGGKKESFSWKFNINVTKLMNETSTSSVKDSESNKNLKSKENREKKSVNLALYIEGNEPEQSPDYLYNAWSSAGELLKNLFGNVKNLNEHNIVINTDGLANQIDKKVTFEEQKDEHTSEILKSREGKFLGSIFNFGSSNKENPPFEQDVLENKTQTEVMHDLIFINTSDSNDQKSENKPEAFTPSILIETTLKPQELDVLKSPLVLDTTQVISEFSTSERIITDPNTIIMNSEQPSIERKNKIVTPATENPQIEITLKPQELDEIKLTRVSATTQLTSEFPISKSMITDKIMTISVPPSIERKNKTVTPETENSQIETSLKPQELVLKLHPALDTTQLTSELSVSERIFTDSTAIRTNSEPLSIERKNEIVTPAAENPQIEISAGEIAIKSSEVLKSLCKILQSNIRMSPRFLDFPDEGSGSLETDSNVENFKANNNQISETTIGSVNPKESQTLLRRVWFTIRNLSFRNERKLLERAQKSGEDTEDDVNRVVFNGLLNGLEGKKSNKTVNSIESAISLPADFSLQDCREVFKKNDNTSDFITQNQIFSNEDVLTKLSTIDSNLHFTEKTSLSFDSGISNSKEQGQFKFQDKTDFFKEDIPSTHIAFKLSTEPISPIQPEQLTSVKLKPDFFELTESAPQSFTSIPILTTTPQKLFVSMSIDKLKPNTTSSNDLINVDRLENTSNISPVWEEFSDLDENLTKESTLPLEILSKDTELSSNLTNNEERFFNDLIDDDILELGSSDERIFNFLGSGERELKNEDIEQNNITSIEQQEIFIPKFSNIGNESIELPEVSSDGTKLDFSTDKQVRVFGGFFDFGSGERSLNEFPLSTNSESSEFIPTTKITSQTKYTTLKSNFENIYSKIKTEPYDNSLNISPNDNSESFIDGFSSGDLSLHDRAEDRMLEMSGEFSSRDERDGSSNTTEKKNCLKCSEHFNHPTDVSETLINETQKSNVNFVNAGEKMDKKSTSNDSVNDINDSRFVDLLTDSEIQSLFNGDQIILSPEPEPSSISPNSFSKRGGRSDDFSPDLSNLSENIGDVIHSTESEQSSASPIFSRRGGRADDLPDTSQNEDSFDSTHFFTDSNISSQPSSPNLSRRGGRADDFIPLEWPSSNLNDTLNNGVHFVTELPRFSSPQTSEFHDENTLNMFEELSTVSEKSDNEISIVGNTFRLPPSRQPGREARGHDFFPPDWPNFVTKANLDQVITETETVETSNVDKTKVSTVLSTLNITNLETSSFKVSTVSTESNKNLSNFQTVNDYSSKYVTEHALDHSNQNKTSVTVRVTTTESVQIDVNINPKIKPSKPKPCRSARECNHSLNERCFSNNGVLACSCAKAFVRNPENRKCEAAITLQTSVRFPGEKFVDDLKDRNSWLFQEKRKETIETLWLLLKNDPELFLSVAEIDVDKFEEGSLFVKLNVKTLPKGNESISHLAEKIDNDLKEVFEKGTMLFKTPLNISSASALTNVVNFCTSNEWNYCNENAECILNDENGYRCRCKEGYLDNSKNKLYPGEVCITYCDPNYCGDHGECRLRMNGEKHCLCLGWYFGEKCEISGIIVLACFTAANVLLIIVVLVLALTFKRHRRNFYGRDETDQPRFEFPNAGPSRIVSDAIALDAMEASKFANISTPIILQTPMIKVTSPSFPGSSIEYDSTFDRSRFSENSKSECEEKKI